MHHDGTSMSEAADKCSISFGWVCLCAHFPGVRARGRAYGRRKRAWVGCGVAVCAPDTVEMSHWILGAQ